MVQLFDQASALNSPSGIDIEDEKIYIADNSKITIFNLRFETLSSWPLPTLDNYFRGLKVNDNCLYLTIYGVHQIYTYNRHDGQLLKIIGSGKEGKEQGQFNCPMGLTVDSKYLYVCDNCNNRIQVLIKFEGNFKTQWKQNFYYPIAIFNYENIFYVGDNYMVQLFTSDGFCIQRLGSKVVGDKMNQFRLAYGICCLGDRLYVSDFTNRRIQIFKRDSKYSWIQVTEVQDESA